MRRKIAIVWEGRSGRIPREFSYTLVPPRMRVGGIYSLDPKQIGAGFQDQDLDQVGRGRRQVGGGEFCANTFRGGFELG